MQSPIKPGTKIVVTSYVTTNTRAAAAAPQPLKLRRSDDAPERPIVAGKIRRRFAARFDGDEALTDFVAVGHSTEDAAVGALIRQAVQSFDTADAIIDFLAALFEDTSHRGPDVALARAVRFANRHPDRRHAGVPVEFPKPAPAVAASAKGGVA